MSNFISTFAPNFHNHLWVLLYSIVIAVGVLLGKIKIGGISLGVTFVLFAGILAGHIGFTAPTNVLTFIQDFGLVLFVFMIGMQVGPGFFESFGAAGVKLNALATTGIVLNIAVMFACYYIFFDTSNSHNLPMMVGTLYGAVTNTPGVIGIIGATILVRYLCKIKLNKEEEDLERQANENANVKPHKMHIQVSNAYLEGKTLLQVHDFLNRDFVCSRILHDGHVSIPNRNTIFHLGDQLLVVCSEADAEAIIAFIGPEIKVNWEKQDQPMVSKRILVTRPSINGKTLGGLHLSRVHGVNVTRVTRQGMDIFASASLHLRVGDRLMVVGPEDAVNRVSDMMGNSIRRLNAPNIATIFIGIIIGIVFGSIPIAIPGMPVPLKLGIAGGPLIMAILIGRYGYKIHLVTYTTTSANMMLREIGLVLFLARRRFALCAHRFPDNRYTYSNSGTYSTNALQVQLFHHNGYDCGILHRPSSIGIRQLRVLKGGTCGRLLHGLPAEHVPQNIHRTNHCAVLLRSIGHDKARKQQSFRQ